MMDDKRRVGARSGADKISRYYSLSETSGRNYSIGGNIFPRPAGPRYGFGRDLSRHSAASAG